MKRRWGAVAVVGLVGWFVAGLPGALALVAALFLGPVIAERRRRRRERRRLAVDLAGALETSARTVRSGASLLDALDQGAHLTPGPAADRIAELVWWLRHDHHDDAVAQWASGSDDPSVAVVAAVVGMVSGSAGGVARGLEAGATVLRAREHARAEIDAGSTQARASALMLVVAPIVFAVGALCIMPGSLTGVRSQPVLLAAVAVGVAFEACGAVWTRRLLRAAQEGHR